MLSPLVSGVSVRSSYPGSIFSGSNVGKQFTLSPGFTRSASAKRESHFLSILEYEAHQSFVAEAQKRSETRSRTPSERSPVLRRASMDASSSASLASSQNGSVANYGSHSRLKSPTLKYPTWSRAPSQMDASPPLESASDSPPLKSGTLSRSASQTSLAPSQNGSVANYGHHSRSKSPVYYPPLPPSLSLSPPSLSLSAPSSLSLDFFTSVVAQYTQLYQQAVGCRAATFSVTRSHFFPPSFPLIFLSVVAQYTQQYQQAVGC
jgi:hypothetical protein